MTSKIVMVWLCLAVYSSQMVLPLSGKDLPPAVTRLCVLSLWMRTRTRKKKNLLSLQEMATEMKCKWEVNKNKKRMLANWITGANSMGIIQTEIDWIYLKHDRVLITKACWCCVVPVMLSTPLTCSMEQLFLEWLQLAPSHAEQLNLHG